MRKAMANPCIGSGLMVLRISMSSVPWSMSTLVMSRCPLGERLVDKKPGGVWQASHRMSREEILRCSPNEGLSDKSLSGVFAGFTSKVKGRGDWPAIFRPGGTAEISRWRNHRYPMQWDPAPWKGAGSKLRPVALSGLECFLG